MGDTSVRVTLLRPLADFEVLALSPPAVRRELPLERAEVLATFLVVLRVVFLVVFLDAGARVAVFLVVFLVVFFAVFLVIFFVVFLAISVLGAARAATVCALTMRVDMLAPACGVMRLRACGRTSSRRYTGPEGACD